MNKRGTGAVFFLASAIFFCSPYGNGMPYIFGWLSLLIGIWYIVTGEKEVKEEKEAKEAKEAENEAKEAEIPADDEKKE